MDRITIDDVLRAQLDGSSVLLEICDQTGRTLGHVVPAPPPAVRMIARTLRRNWLACSRKRLVARCRRFGSR